MVKLAYIFSMFINMLAATAVIVSLAISPVSLEGKLIAGFVIYVLGFVGVYSFRRMFKDETLPSPLVEGWQPTKGGPKIPPRGNSSTT